MSDSVFGSDRKARALWMLSKEDVSVSIDGDPTPEAYIKAAHCTHRTYFVRPGAKLDPFRVSTEIVVGCHNCPLLRTFVPRTKDVMYSFDG